MKQAPALQKERPKIHVQIIRIQKRYFISIKRCKPLFIFFCLWI